MKQKFNPFFNECNKLLIMNSFSFFNEYKGAILTQSVLKTFALKKVNK